MRTLIIIMTLLIPLQASAINFADPIDDTSGVFWVEHWYGSEWWMSKYDCSAALVAEKKVGDGTKEIVFITSRHCMGAGTTVSFQSYPGRRFPVTSQLFSGNDVVSSAAYYRAYGIPEGLDLGEPHDMLPNSRLECTRALSCNADGLLDAHSAGQPRCQEAAITHTGEYDEPDADPLSPHEVYVLNEQGTPNDPANPQYARFEAGESGTIALTADGALCGAAAGMTWLGGDDSSITFNSELSMPYQGTDGPLVFGFIPVFCQAKVGMFNQGFCPDMTQCPPLPSEFYCERNLDACGWCEDIDFYACPNSVQTCGMDYATDGDKVTICHNNVKTLVINQSALPAHLEHGDSVGACN